MPLWMMTFGFWEREALLVWQAGRAPIAAAAAALAAWLLGRLLRSARLQAAAGGLALCAGWAVALGLTVAPRMPAERLPMLAAVALAAGVAADLSGRAAGLAGWVLAIAAGWWLAGAPHSDAAAGLVLPQMACLALAVLLALRVLRTPRGPWACAAAALALWGALVAARAPGWWTGLALVLLVAGLGQVGLPQGTAPGRRPMPVRLPMTVRLPMAAGLAGLAGLAVLALGRLGRGGVSRVDLAALAPLAAIWATPRLAARLPWLGGAGGAVAAAALAVALAWGAGRLGLVH
jgi:hypothetical protein